jgi:hypothetical protein
MGCPSPRRDLANLRTGNPRPHPGSPRPNKWEHPDPHREPIRRNSGSVPTGAGANHYPGCRAPARTMAVPHLHGSGRPTHLDGSRFRPLWGGVRRRRRRQNKQSCQRHSQNAHVSALCKQASSPGENGSAQTFYPVRQAFIADRRATGLPLALATLGVVRDASNLQSGPQHPLRRSLNLSGSIGTMGSGAVVIAVAWGRWCGGSPGYGAQAAADCRTDASTTPAAGDRTDDSPGAGADQAAAERTFAGIVRVCGSRRRQQQSSADHARYSRLPFHSLSTDTVQGRDLLGCRPPVKEVCPGFPSVKNTNGQGCSSVPRLRGGRRRAGPRRSRPRA